MPGPMTYVTDQITDGRRHNLDAYVRNLLRQPPYISRCGLVKQFFAPREGDFEVDSNANYDDNGSGSRSSGGTPDGAASRQSSRGDLNGGNVNGGGGGYGGLSARPNPPANGAAGVYQSQQAGLRQASSMTQASQTSLPGLNGPGPGTSGTPSAQMKVKIYFGDDLFAIRVPSDILFQQLYEKIRERLKIPEGEGMVLSYKDEGSGERPGLVSQGDLETALGRNEKLVVVVELS
jgi:bud emergence protein 1